ncbi:sodium/proline symporter PutP [Pseudomonas aeruginosa PA38182]|nr:sodium/proline symporter PutP [Pseudomonas aeruginosa PA38182]
MSVNTPTLITFVIYIAAMVLIGLAAYRSTNNFSDYILGGRSLGSFVTALSAGASDMSGWLLMGLPGAVYLSGLSESWIAIGLIVGAYLNWLFVAGRLRVQTEHNGNALTLPDYFTNRFEDNSRLLRIFSALVILVFFTIYCASGIVAGARLFESTFGLSYETALWAGAAATIAYTFIGGFLAVSWTDTVQASLMIFALILTPVIVMLATGGVEPTFTAIELKDATSFDMLKGASFIGVISLMAWGLGYFGQPHILARFMAADSVKSIPAARRISMTWMILCLGGAVAVGFFGIAYFQAHPEQAGAVSENPERVFIELAKILFNPWIAGVLLSAILAAVMSTLRLPAAGLLLGAHRGLLQGLPAQGRQPAGTGLGRSRHGAAGGGDRHLAGLQPGKPRARPGVLCLGRLRRRLRPAGAVLPAVEADDPQRRAGRHDRRRGDGDPVEEPVGLDRPVRDHPRLPLRQRRHRRLQPARQGAFDEHAQALRRCGAGVPRGAPGSAAPVTQR